MASPGTGDEWKPPAKIEELFQAAAGNVWAQTNRPTAGPRDTIELPSGPASLQLYSLGTPNGQKASIMLEELNEHSGIEYDAHRIMLNGPQFGMGFTAINPNGKIPAMNDKDGPGGEPISVFESASIVLYLAEKYNKFIPSDPRLKVEIMNWLFWQMGGQGPMTGNFGHFMVYAPGDKKEARDYGVARYGMETMRLTDVLERHLATRTYLVGEEYSIADMVVFPWFQQLRVGYKHTSGVAAADFITVDRYTATNAWADRILARPAVKRGLLVCTAGGAKPWLNKE